MASGALGTSLVHVNPTKSAEVNTVPLVPSVPEKINGLAR